MLTRPHKANKGFNSCSMIIVENMKHDDINIKIAFALRSAGVRL